MLGCTAEFELKEVLPAVTKRKNPDDIADLFAANYSNQILDCAYFCIIDFKDNVSVCHFSSFGRTAFRDPGNNYAMSNRQPVIPRNIFIQASADNSKPRSPSADFRDNFEGVLFGSVYGYGKAYALRVGNDCGVNGYNSAFRID